MVKAWHSTEAEVGPIRVLNISLNIILHYMRGLRAFYAFAKNECRVVVAQTVGLCLEVV